MSELNPAERELAALGAALGSNCAPCVAFHITAARQAGLTEAQIADAIAVAEKVRRVPARAAIDAALRALPPGAVKGASDPGNAQPRCC